MPEFYLGGVGCLVVLEDGWTDGVLWWEIYCGTGFALGAVYFAKTADRIANAASSHGRGYIRRPAVRIFERPSIKQIVRIRMGMD